MEQLPFSGAFVLVAFVAGVVAGFWGRKYWGKKDAESLAKADADVKKFGDRL